MATIKDYSLLLVQTNGEANSIRFDAIKEELAPLAKKDSALLGTTGTPGLMFPGKTMVYNSSTGQLDVSSSVVKEHIGLIGYNEEEEQVKNMSGFESPGNFYIVSDFNHKYLSNDWGSEGSDPDHPKRVYLGDIVEKRNDETGDWNVIPMQIGNQHVHNDFGKYPHISATGDPAILSGDSPGVSDETIIQASGY